MKRVISYLVVVGLAVASVGIISIPVEAKSWGRWAEIGAGTVGLAGAATLFTLHHIREGKQSTILNRLKELDQLIRDRRLELLNNEKFIDLDDQIGAWTDEKMALAPEGVKLAGDALVKYGQEISITLAVISAFMLHKKATGIVLGLGALGASINKMRLQYFSKKGKEYSDLLETISELEKESSGLTAQEELERAYALTEARADLSDLVLQMKREWKTADDVLMTCAGFAGGVTFLLALLHGSKKDRRDKACKTSKN